MFNNSVIYLHVHFNYLYVENFERCNELLVFAPVSRIICLNRYYVLLLLYYRSNRKKRFSPMGFNLRILMTNSYSAINAQLLFLYSQSVHCFSVQLVIVAQNVANTKFITSV